MRYYLQNNGTVSGPFEEEQLHDWGRAGQLQGGMTLAPDGSEQWTSIHLTPFAQYLPPTSKSTGKTNLLVVLGMVVLVVFVLGMCRLTSNKGSGKTVAATTQATEPVPTDRACVLRSGTSMVPVFPTEEGMDEFGVAAARKDEAGMRVALTANRGFMAESGTKCSFLDVGIMRTRVRVTEGHTRADPAGFLLSGRARQPPEAYA